MIHLTLFEPRNMNSPKKTAANLAFFMHHWLISCRYNSSTWSQLMCFIYIEKAQLAGYSICNPESWTATSCFASRTSMYNEDNCWYDPSALTSQQKCQKMFNSVFDMSPTINAGLLKTLGHRSGETFMAIGSHLSGVSPHTGGHLM